MQIKKGEHKGGSMFAKLIYYRYGALYENKANCKYFTSAMLPPQNHCKQSRYMNNPDIMHQFQPD